MLKSILMEDQDITLNSVFVDVQGGFHDNGGKP